MTAGTARPAGSAQVHAEITGLAARALQRAGDDPDRAWAALAAAGLLGLAVPAARGGDGLGVAEVCAVIAETGRAGAEVPVAATLALGVLPLARWGTPAQQADALDPVVTGGAVLTAALGEPSAPLTATPRTVGATAGGGYVLRGVKTRVPFAGRAHRVLVPATVDGTPGVFVVDPRLPGVSVTPGVAAGAAPADRLELRDVRVGPGALLPGGGAALADLCRLGAVAAAALADGLLDGALRLTAAHVAGRHQFGRPLVTFQAVAQQLADVHIAARTTHLAALAAAAAVADPAGPAGDAWADPEVAALWVVDQARTAMATCHHLHGGTGLDAGYPLPRYSAALTDLAHQLGGTDPCLDALADRLAARPATGLPGGDPC